MEKKFITQTFDKFTEKTITKSNPVNVKLGEIGSSKRYKIGIRHVQSPKTNFLLLDVTLNTPEWNFIRSGKMIIKADAERFELDAYENYTEVLGYKGDKNMGMEESAYYYIDKPILKKICDAESVEIRVVGDRYADFAGEALANFQLMCRQFYNNFYDELQYEDALKKKVDTGSGCFIATAAMGNYNHPVVMDLRQFRDNWLLKRNWGVRFTGWYYTHGPEFAQVIEKSDFLRKITFIFVVKPLQLITKGLK